VAFASAERAGEERVFALLNEAGGERHDQWTYYRCRGSMRAVDRCQATYCRSKPPIESLERIYAEIMVCAMTRAQFVRLATEAALEASRSLEGERTGLRMQLAVLQQREDHLTRACGEGVLSPEAFSTALREIAEQVVALKGQLREALNPAGNRLDQLRPTVERVKSAWDLHILLFFSEQRLLLQTIFETPGTRQLRHRSVHYSHHLVAVQRLKNSGVVQRQEQNSGTSRETSLGLRRLQVVVDR
jgi:hypothetical protein